MYTFTDAAFKYPRCNRNGWYPDKYVIEYGKYAKLICPDDTEIETEHHSAYGMIGMYDVYELVVDWNREDLKKLFSKKDPKDHFYKLKEIAELYGNGKNEEEIEEYMREHNYDMSLTIFEEWKRNIGIAIACYRKDMQKLRFPLKMTKDKNIHGYNNLYRSYQTQ